MMDTRVHHGFDYGPNDTPFDDQRTGATLGGAGVGAAFGAAGGPAGSVLGAVAGGRAASMAADYLEEDDDFDTEDDRYPRD